MTKSSRIEINLERYFREPINCYFKVQKGKNYFECSRIDTCIVTILRNGTSHFSIVHKMNTTIISLNNVSTCNIHFGQQSAIIEVIEKAKCAFFVFAPATFFSR